MHIEGGSTKVSLSFICHCCQTLALTRIVGGLAMVNGVAKVGVRVTKATGVIHGTVTGVV